MNGSGEFIVTWNGAVTGDTEGQDVLFRRYRANGLPLDTPELRANIRTAGDQILPDVAVVPASAPAAYTFIIVWQGPADGSGRPDLVWGRRYGLDGLGALVALDAADVLISAGSSTPQMVPRVAMNSNGNIMVVWWGDTSIRARHFNAGTGSWGSVKVLSDIPAGRAIPDIGTDGDRFVATWHRGSFFNLDLMAVVFDSGGSLVGSRVLVGQAPVTGGRAVAVAPGGGFTVAAAPNDGGNYGIRLWAFDAAGAPAAPPDLGRFVNDTTRGEQWLPSIGMTADGATVVLFQNGADGVYDIRGQYFTADGVRYISNFQVGAVDAGRDLPADVGVNPEEPNPHFAVVWSDGVVDAPSDVFFRLYEPMPLRPNGVDIQVSFDADQQPVVRPGATLTYRFTVSNTGDAEAIDVVVETDRFPAGVTPLSSSPVADTSGGWARWEFAALTPGETLDVVLIVGVGASYEEGDTIPLRVAARGGSLPGEEESHYENNCAEVTVPVVEPPEQVDLRITLIPDSAAVTPGTNVGYTVSCGNIGLAAATNVTVITDPFPPGIMLVSSGGATLVYSNGYAEWSLDTLEGGETNLFWFRVSVDTSYDPGDAFTLRVTIQGESDYANVETNFDNNVSTATMPVEGVSVDLSVSITQLTAPKDVIQESDVAYRIDYRNVGDARAWDVVVEVDTLPAGVTANGPVEWEIGTLTPGSGGSIPLSLHVDASFANGAPFSVTVRVEGVSFPGQGESNFANNEATVTTHVLAAPHIDLQAYLYYGSAWDVAPGETITYRIRALNDYRKYRRKVPQASNVVLRTDPFPPGVTYVSTRRNLGREYVKHGPIVWAPFEPSNDPNVDGYARWEIGDVPGDDRRGAYDLEMTVSIGPPLKHGDSITMGVSISGDAAPGQADLNLANNVDTHITPIIERRPDLGVVMHARWDWSMRRIEYRVLVTNNGMDDAVKVTLKTGPFPAGTTFSNSNERWLKNSPHKDGYAEWDLGTIRGDRINYPYNLFPHLHRPRGQHKMVFFTLAFGDSYPPGDIIPFTVRVEGTGAYGLSEVNLEDNVFTTHTTLARPRR